MSAKWVILPLGQVHWYRIRKCTHSATELSENGIGRLGPTYECRLVNHLIREKGLKWDASNSCVVRLAKDHHGLDGERYFDQISQIEWIYIIGCD